MKCVSVGRASSREVTYSYSIILLWMNKCILLFRAIAIPPSVMQFRSSTSTRHCRMKTVSLSSARYKAFCVHKVTFTIYELCFRCWYSSLKTTTNPLVEACRLLCWELQKLQMASVCIVCSVSSRISCTLSLYNYVLPLAVKKRLYTGLVLKMIDRALVTNEKSERWGARFKLSYLPLWLLHMKYVRHKSLVMVSVRLTARSSLCWRWSASCKTPNYSRHMSVWGEGPLSC